jgi:predicted RNase H-like nuclease (RuvC/YqgF family)
MRLHRLVGLAFLIVACGWGWGSAFGGDSVAEAILKNKGLTRVGRVFVDTAAEQPVLDKMKEIRVTFASYAMVAEKQAIAESIPMQVAELEQQRQMLQATVSTLNQQISAQNSSMGSGRYGRMARMMGPTPLQIEHQQAQAALNQTTAMQRNIKSQTPSAKDKATIDADVKKKGDAFKTQLTELRTMVDDVTKKYDELGADAKVKKSLDDLEKAGHATMKLGPSEAFHAGMKELDAAEKRFLGKKPVVAAKKKSTSKASKK